MAGKENIFFFQCTALTQNESVGLTEQKTEVAIETCMPYTKEKEKKCRPIFLLSWLPFLAGSSACLNSGAP